MEIRIPMLPPFFFIFKPSYIKKVLALEPDNFQTNGYKGVLTKLAWDSGNNILLLPGPPHPNWHRFREITAPINKDRFGETSLVNQMIDTAYKTTQETVVNYLTDKQGQSLDLFKELFHVMLPAHNRALFGEEFEKKFAPKGLNTDLYDVISETGKLLKLAYCPPHLREEYYQKVTRVIDAVRGMAEDSTSPFMKPIQEARRKGILSDHEMISNLMVFEYSQAPLHATFWLLYNLALHPEEEKKVVAEIASLLSQGPVTRERLPEFKYLNKCVSETLRIHPGVGIMQVREVQRSTKLGKHFIPEGGLIFISNFLVHRNAKYFPNPDEFIPSREGIDMSQYGDNLAYIPFGTGPRQCQGQYFAQDFMKVAAISILQHFKVSLAPNQAEAKPSESGFLRPTYPIYVQFEKRAPLATAPQSIVPSPVLAAELEPTRKSPVPVLEHQHSFKKNSPLNLAEKLTQQASLESSAIVGQSPDLSVDQINSSPDLLVCYGSQTGTAHGLATRVVNLANLCEIKASLVVFSELDVSTMKTYKAVVVVTSSYGDGSAPENAEKFESWLEKETSTDIFSGVPYAVLALGSSMYQFAFGFGSLVHRRFSELGGKPFIPLEKIDEVKYNTHEVFIDWSARLFDAIIQIWKGDESEAKNKLMKFDFNALQPPFKLTFTDQSLPHEPRKHFPHNIITTTVTSNELVNSEPTNEIYAMELNYTNDEISFHPGDNVVVIPCNPSSQVEALIGRLGFEKDQVFGIEGEEDLQCSLGLHTCTLEIALSYYFDITTPPSTSMLQFLSVQSKSPEDQKVLAAYLSDYLSFLKLNTSVLELLESMPSIQFEGNEERLAIFLGLLGPIKQRHYSIANFSESSPNLLRIIYKVVSYGTKSGQLKNGVCSNFLKSRKFGEEVMLGIVKSKNFRLPSDFYGPIIMIGAGSGISPYFGFLEQRKYEKTNSEKQGRAVLIHGCRSESDFPNRVKIDEFLQVGVISDLWPAYSREHGVHVQDIVQKQGEELWKLLTEESGIMFTCGDVALGASIRDTLVNIAQNYGKCNETEANAWLQGLVKDGQLRNDEWGIVPQEGCNT
eukprot:Phypoly_transcript_00473.p1 GENE.Phypoly_transcript_00473~~Phypoly_transcript_00473.p1  ORF type:complete len:1072 (+),score=177.20 Phypoly_transcript_00473:1435-4650(+)